MEPKGEQLWGKFELLSEGVYLLCRVMPGITLEGLPWWQSDSSFYSLDG